MERPQSFGRIPLRTVRMMRLGCIVLALLAGGCEVFAVREPEEPQVGTGGVFVQPDTPNAVLENLVNAVREMNAINYLNCLSTDFDFTPASQGNIGDPTLWNGWGRVEEDLYFKNMASASENLTGHSLTFSDIRRDDLSNMEQRVIATYALVVNTNRNTGSRVPNRITGEVVFVLRSNAAGLWSIHSWTDINTNAEYSWTQLKAEFIKG